MRVSTLFSRLVLTGCLVSASMPAVFGQDERPQRGQGGGPGGQGGPGGRGMMRFGGGMMGGMGGGLLGVIGIEKVQEHLKLDDNQKDEVKGIVEENRAEGRKIFEEMRNAAGGGGGGGRGPSEEMMAKITKLATQAEEKLGDILDPAQMDRLIGLMIQQNPVGSISHKVVSEKLGVSDEQKASLKKVQEETGAKMREAFSGGPPGPESFAKMEELRKESETKSMDVLTADQKAKLESLKGEKFEFPAPEFGRGQGGGRGPGGPGGPGGAGGQGRGRGRGGNNDA